MLRLSADGMREKAVEAMARRLLSFLWTDSALLQRLLVRPRAGVKEAAWLVRFRVLNRPT
jgi:hypothetical protein